MAALTIVAQACLGLASAHAAGVVHRDIKPGNIFVARGDDEKLIVKLIDFGVAKLTADLEGSGSAELTRTGSILGTPMYLSPEQAEGKQSIDAQSDLWSLGVVLFKALTGTVPHDTDEGSIPQLVVAICTQPAPSVQDRAPWVSAEIDAIVRRALSIDRGKRYRSADEMLADIRALVPGDLELTSDMLVPPSAEERRHVRTRERERVSRSRALGTIGVALVLAASVVVALLAVGHDSDEAKTGTVVASPSVDPEAPKSIATTAPARVSADAGVRAKPTSRLREAPAPRKSSAKPPTELRPTEGFE
jgi:serine/threonine protein kinase